MNNIYGWDNTCFDIIKYNDIINDEYCVIYWDDSISKHVYTLDIICKQVWKYTVCSCFWEKKKKICVWFWLLNTDSI